MQHHKGKNMAKKKGSFKNSLFFLVGVLVYSLLYWITGHNYAHVFGMLIIALACYILYKLESGTKAWIQTEHVIAMCFGVIFDSLSNGFPFGFL